MKKSILLILTVFLAACSVGTNVDVSVPKSDSSPCDSVMTVESFARTYENKEVTFMGAYTDGVVFAFEVEGDVICTHNFNEEVLSELIFYQDVIEDNIVGTELVIIFDEGANYLIGSTGILSYQETETGEILDVAIHRTKSVTILGKPETCTELDKASIQNFNLKEIKVIGATDNENGLESLYFQSNGENYCFENASISLVKQVTDIFGDSFFVSNYFLGTNLYQFMDFSGVLKVLEDEDQNIVFLEVGNKTSAVKFVVNEPKLFEVMSHSGPGRSYIDSVDWNISRGKYKLVNSKEMPDKVNNGYLYAPKSYVNGGEVEVGSVLGSANGTKVVVTEVVCALGGISLVPVYRISYTSSEGGSYTIPEPDTYLFLIEGEGVGQVVTFYHIPAVNAECQTSY